MEIGAYAEVVAEVDESRQAIAELRENQFPLLRNPGVTEDASVALIVSGIVFVDQLNHRIEPMPQLVCAVVIYTGHPNLPSGDDLLEIRTEPVLGIRFGLAGPPVDMRGKTHQVLPHFFTEHNALWAAFEPLGQFVVEVSRAAVPRRRGKAVRQFSEVVKAPARNGRTLQESRWDRASGTGCGRCRACGGSLAGH